MVEYRDPGPVTFDAVIHRAGQTGSSAFIEFPFDVEELYGVRGRVPVAATFDGIGYRGSLVTYGGENHLILVLTDIRRRLGKEPGDSVQVTIALDTAERMIELAEDEEVALRATGQLDAFRGLSYSHQREYHLWIEDAKRPETRARRIQRMTEFVAGGRRSP